MQKQPTKMWSGRFRDPLNPTFEAWQRSYPFDLVHHYRSSNWAVPLVLLIGAIVIFLPSLMRKLDLGTPKATNQVAGDWVGPFTLSGTYKPAIYGDTPGPHTSGTMYLHAYRMSPNLDWLEAEGQICLAGEPVVRIIELHILHYASDGSFSAEISATPNFGAFPWKGTVTPDTLTLGNDIELALHARLQRGTRADFRRQSTCAQPKAED